MNSKKTNAGNAPKTGRILIVDDKEIVHHTLKRLLISEGYTIDSVYGGAEALDRLYSGYDLVICDIRMPGMDGIEVVQEIRKREFDVEVLFLTGYASPENATVASDCGVRGYVTKPIENIAEFRAGVGESVYSAQIAHRERC